MNSIPHPEQEQALNELVARHTARCQIRLRAELNLSSASLWAKVSDLGNLHRYMPMISRIDVSHPACGVGEGSERVCHLPMMGALQEKVLGWSEGRGFAFTASGRRVPFRNHLGVIQIVPQAPNACTLIWEQYFEPRFGPLGWIFPILLKRLMARAVGAMAREAGGRARITFPPASPSTS